MLIKMDRTGKTESIYKCDRCNKKILTDIEDRFKVTIQKTPKSYHNNVIKTWDLCKRCYSALHRGIEKGVVKG